MKFKQKINNLKQNITDKDSEILLSKNNLEMANIKLKAIKDNFNDEATLHKKTKLDNKILIED